MDRNEYIVEVKVTKEELASINKLLGFAYSPKAKQKTSSASVYDPTGSLQEPSNRGIY